MNKLSLNSSIMVSDVNYCIQQVAALFTIMMRFSTFLTEKEHLFKKCNTKYIQVLRKVIYQMIVSKYLKYLPSKHTVVLR